MKILAVIVLYHPNRDHLITLVKNCLVVPGCDVFLSDNASIDDGTKNALKQCSPEQVFYHDNSKNIGVGGAQNRGIQYGIAHNYDTLVLFDQDSQIDEHFLSRLVKEFELAKEKDPSIIAVGPSFVDPRLTGRRAVKGKVEQNTYKNMIIASGCMMTVPALKIVGLLDESLFIDHVDTEWCYRAKAKGYHVMQLSNVVMHHTIGEIKKTWWGYHLQYHHYFRYYYIFRNSIVLLKIKTIPLRDRLYILFRNIVYVLKIPFLDHRYQRLKGLFKGTWDGIMF